MTNSFLNRVELQMSIEMRLFGSFWDSLPNNVKPVLLDEFQIAEGTELEQQKKYKEIWKVTLLHRLFNEHLLAFTGTIPSKISDLRNSIKANFSTVTVETLVKEKSIYVATKFHIQTPTLKKRPQFRPETYDVAFFFPKQNLCLVDMVSASTGTWDLEKCLELKPVRIRSLENSKLYNSQEKIKKLRVATIQEIAGFIGLDHIEFVGESVKEGLKGLQVRQEIKVNLENMGPKLLVATNNLEIMVGGKIHLKSFLGIDELNTLIS